MWPTVDRLAIVELPKFAEGRGLLVPIEFPKYVPFAVKRLFWICDVPPGGERGAHAHKSCHQFMICTAGRIAITVFDGNLERSFELMAGQALHVEPGIFATERFVDPGSILIVLCDKEYNADDYLPDREATAKFRHEHIR
jgi:hypothetical protein